MTLSDVRILITGPRPCCGIGISIRDALIKAGKPTRWQAFICHKDTTVDELGRVSYPLDSVPIEIHRRAVKQEFVNFTQEEDNHEQR